MSLFLIVISMLIWGTQGIIIRVSSLEPHVIIFYSLVVSLIIQSGIFISPAIRGQIPSFKQILKLALISTIGFINVITFFYAYSYTSISNAVFTHYIAPIVVAVLAPLFLQERIGIKTVVAIIVASVGLWIMLGYGRGAAAVIDPGADFLHSQRAGIVAGLISGITYGVLVIVVRLVIQVINPYVMIFFQNLCMTLFLLPFAEPLPIKHIWAVIVMGVLHATIAPFLYYQGLKRTEATKAAVLGYIEPVSAIIFGMVFLREYPRPISLAGGFLIILSGYLIIRK